MNPEDEFDIGHYLTALRRRMWVIIVAVTVCGLAAAAASYSQTKVYTASAKVLISAQQDISGTGNALSDPNQLQNQMQTQVQIVESAQVEQIAREALNADAVRVKSVKAAGVTNTRVMTISAVSESPLVAQKAANAYGDAYLKVGQQTAVDRVASIGQTVAEKQNEMRGQIARIDEQLNAKPAPNRDTAASLNNQREAIIAQIDQLQRQYDNAQANALVREAAAAPFAGAELPTSPSAPKPLRSIALAIVLGALLGTALVLIWDRLDTKIRTSEDLSRFFPALAQIGLIPRIKGWRKGQARNVALADPLGPIAEAYRGIRTNIEFLGIDRELQVIELTSSTAGEGKTTTVANLATALAWTGKHVIVVGADLRRPRIHKFFDIGNETGLTSVVLGNATLEATLQQIPLEGTEGTVHVLSTGPLPPNPSELLASTAVQDIFIKLRERADYVLIDAPPLLPVSDPLVLSKYADGLVLVAGMDKIGRGELGHALEIVETSTHTPLLGVVVNGANEGPRYAYKYKYGYYEDSENGKGRPRTDANAKKFAPGSKKPLVATK